MVYGLFMFRHYLLGNKFVIYVNHMALVYLVNKPHVSSRIVKWLLLLLKYDFTILYKLGCTHVVVDEFSILPNTTKPTSVPNQITYANLFHLQPIWLENKRLSTDGTNVQYFGPSTQKQRLAKLTNSFIKQNGMLYQMGLDNKLGQCITTYEAQKILWELHEGCVGGHFAMDVTTKRILDAGY